MIEQDPAKAYRTPLKGEAKKKYDENWEKIFRKKEENKTNNDLKIKKSIL